MPLVSRLAVAALLAAPLALSSCSDTERSATPPPSDAPPCPSSPVEVLVSVDQWGDIVSELGGACANVTTLLASSSVDPHDYEPSPADAAKFSGAQLVALNGGHYDEWAAKLAASSAPDAPIVDAVEISTGHAEEHGDGDHDGDDHAHGEDAVNPHVWYQPATVTGVADAVTAQLSKLSPAAADYFAERRTEFAAALAPYDGLVASIKQSASGKSYGATESVFDDMAAALGLQNKTPQGYQNAASNETDPSPADLDAFLSLLRAKGVDVLIYNTQTQGSVPEQLRAAAESAGVPVVEVTETVAPGAESFEAWQVAQLTSLAKALGVATEGPPALSFDDVSVVRGGRLIWSEGTFEVPAGGIVAVIGSSGSGKTTLLHAVLGMIPIASGDLRVLGEPPGAATGLIGYVPQNYAAAAGGAIRARDAVTLGLTGNRWGFGRASAEQRHRVDEILAAVDATEFAQRRLSQLSGGQRQRIAIAEALVGRPRLLILDEPLTALDVRNQRAIVGLLSKIRDEFGVTIVVVAHDLNPLLGILDGAIYLLDGHAHFDTMDEVVDEELLTHLYGTSIQVVHTPQGELYMRSV